MRAHEYFDLVKAGGYTKSGKDVDWKIVVNDGTREVILVFEGSTTWRDWLANFDFPVRPYKKQQNTLWAHRGWAGRWKGCNDEVCAAVWRYEHDIMDRDYSLTIVGHSYGGAVAQLAAEDIFFRHGIRARLVTFGSPRPLFGRKTARHVESCLVSARQWLHANDMVGAMPPLPGYRRVSTTRIGKFNLWHWLTKVRRYHSEIYWEADAYRGDA